MEYSKDPRVNVDGMIQNLSLVVSETKDKKEDDFLNNVVLLSAVCYWFIKVGEAAKRVSKNCEKNNILLNPKHTELLSKLAKLKDFLTHQYDKVNSKLVYKFLRLVPDDILCLEELKKDLDKILNKSTF